MKIVEIEQFFPLPRVRLVKVSTDAGIVGWGETTLEGKPKSTVAAVEELSDYFIGKDPLRIEHHWQHVYRSAFFRGGNVLMSALSGIDQALWDITGKHFGVPVYQLLGGAVRDRIRVYAHWGLRDMSDEAKAYYQGLFKQVFDSPEWAEYRKKKSLQGEFLSGDDLMKYWMNEREIHRNMLTEMGALKG